MEAAQDNNTKGEIDTLTAITSSTQNSTDSSYTEDELSEDDIENIHYLLLKKISNLSKSNTDNRVHFPVYFFIHRI